MSAVFLSVHVILAILAIGPIAFAASIFPRYADSPAAAGVLTDAWVLVSIGLTAVAAAVLTAAILPAQRRALEGGGVGTLAMTTGIFNLLWVAVTVLMIVRPGSSTGV